MSIRNYVHGDICFESSGRGPILSEKVAYSSGAMLKWLDGHGLRQGKNEAHGDTSAIHEPTYMDILVSRIKDYDPEGDKAFSLAAEYRKKKSLPRATECVAE